MNDEPKLEVMKPPGAQAVLAPIISVTEDEAAQIIFELGLSEIESPKSDSSLPKKNQCGFDIRKAMRLGAFVEENAVRLDNAKILVADHILVTHMMRLNEKAKTMQTAKELSEIAYPIGYIAAQVKKSSKTKIIVEAVQGGNSRQTQQSWAPGEVVKPAKAS